MTHHDNDNAAVSTSSVTLHLGDCLDKIKTVATGSVSIIIADLPYGTTAAEWDKHLNYTALIPEFERVLTPLGTVVAFASDAFTFRLHAAFEQYGNELRYQYSDVWEKNVGSTLAHCKNRPNKLHEDILIFSKGKMGHAGEGMGKSRRRMTYNPQGLVELATPKANSGKRGTSAHVRQSIYLHDTGGQMCRKDGRQYTFSDSTHTNYPSTIKKYNRVQSQGHPTTKPTDLLEELIRTYSHEGETVLDPTMGSGTTGAACVQSGRTFIGIEMNAAYFEVARRRIAASGPPATSQAAA